jgi:hypothetical protein
MDISVLVCGDLCTCVWKFVYLCVKMFVPLCGDWLTVMCISVYILRSWFRASY